MRSRNIVVCIGIVAITAAVFLTVDMSLAHQKGWPGKRLSQTFPEAAKFTSRQVTLSTDQMARIEQAIGERLEANNRTPTFYPATGQSGEKVGFVVFSDQTGENGAIEIGVAVDTEGRVRHLVIFESREDKRIQQSAFLDQFHGKTVKDTLKLGLDITPVPGAEKGSQAVATGVRKVLLIKQEVYGDQIP